MLVAVVGLAIVGAWLAERAGERPAPGAVAEADRSVPAGEETAAEPPADAPGEMASSQPPTPDEAEPRNYRIGIAPADADTRLDWFMDSEEGIEAQCEALNRTVASVCCARYGMGCAVTYSCMLVAVGDSELIDEYYRTRYSRELLGTGYAVHHASSLEAMVRYLRTLQLYGRTQGMLVAGYTRHQIIVDDQETKSLQRKIDPADPTLPLIGRLVPGLSKRGGRRMILDYYASEDGLFLSVTPAQVTSLAQALAEYRSGLFSFRGKQFTGTGGRVLFELGEDKLVPTRVACDALTVREPDYYRFLLEGGGESSE